MGLVHDCGRASIFDDWHDTLLRVRQNTLGFVNEEALSVHGNVRTSSIFISQSGEWRLGGLEVLSSMKEDDAVIYVRFLLQYEFRMATYHSQDLCQLSARLGKLCLT